MSCIEHVQVVVDPVHQPQLGSMLCAGAALLVFLSLLLMLLCQSQYVRYRRLVMWSNLVAISVMVRDILALPQAARCGLFANI